MLVCGLTKDDFHNLSQVQITDRVPSLEHSLPNTINIEEHLDFCDIEYPTVNHSYCDLLIGANHFELLLPGREKNSIMFLEIYMLLTLVLAEDFEETPNDNEAALSDKD